MLQLGVSEQVTELILQNSWDDLGKKSKFSELSKLKQEKVEIRVLVQGNLPNLL